jgi:hypothetical protein
MWYYRDGSSVLGDEDGFDGGFKDNTLGREEV